MELNAAVLFPNGDAEAVFLASFRGSALPKEPRGGKFLWFALRRISLLGGVFLLHGLVNFENAVPGDLLDSRRLMVIVFGV